MCVGGFGSWGSLGFRGLEVDVVIESYPVATRRSLENLVRGAAAAANKLDALLYVLQLEVAISDQPHLDMQEYSDMVICNCSDQGLA